MALWSAVLPSLRNPSPGARPCAPGLLSFAFWVCSLVLNAGFVRTVSLQGSSSRFVARHSDFFRCGRHGGGTSVFPLKATLRRCRVPSLAFPTGLDRARSIAAALVCILLAPAPAFAQSAVVVVDQSNSDETISDGSLAIDVSQSNFINISGTNAIPIQTIL
jgi:hypothetical protein